MYRSVYSEINGALVQNKDRFVKYKDEKGIDRTITNPTYKDFKRVGKLPKREIMKKPSYDESTHILREVYVKKDDFFEISYEVIKKEERI